MPKQPIKHLHKGELLTVAEMGLKYNMRPETIRSRIARGWTLEEAVSKKVRVIVRGSMNWDRKKKKK